MTRVGVTTRDGILQSVSSTDLHFNINVIPRKEKIHRVELLLFTERLNRKSHRFKNNLIKIYERNKTLLRHVKKVIRNRIGYVKIDITSTINSWINNTVDDTTLTVEQDRHEKHSPHGHVFLRKRREITAVEWHQKRPLIVVYSSSNEKNIVQSTSKAKQPLKQDIRERRSAESFYKYELLRNNHNRAERETCRMRPFSLDFRGIGWSEWILAPTDCKINYCSGDCPRPLASHHNTTNHAVIQNSVLALSKQLVPPLCCIPTTFNTQTFLYLENEKLVVRNSPQMVALGCGCR